MDRTRNTAYAAAQAVETAYKQALAAYEAACDDGVDIMVTRALAQRVQTLATATGEAWGMYALTAEEAAREGDHTGGNHRTNH